VKRHTTPLQVRLGLFCCTLLLGSAPPTLAQQPIPVGGEFQVNTYTTNGQTYPSVSVAPDGGFVVVWQSRRQDGSYASVQGQRYDSGGSRIGGEFQVNTYTTGGQAGPSVAASSAGGFVVVWQGWNQDGWYDVFGRRYTSEGTPAGDEFQVNTYTTS
jgi:hypothetical protein